MFLRAFERFDTIGNNPAIGGWLTTVIGESLAQPPDLFPGTLAAVQRDRHQRWRNNVCADTIPAESTSGDEHARLEASFRALPDHQRVPLVIVLGALAGAVFLAQENLDAVRQAAQQGDAAAQFKLGVIYAEGRGVRKDFVLAYMWLSIAGDNGFAVARMDRDKLATNDDFLVLGAIRRWSRSMPST